MQTPMKVVVSLCLGAALFVAGYMSNRRPAPGDSPASARQILYYACPMHPQYKSSQPGDAPCCGMRMVPVYADGAGGAERTDGSSPAMVRVNAARQQLIGVRIDEVKRAPVAQVLRAPGRIAVDEARSHRIISAVDGWIRQLGENTAGTFVKKDQILASYYTNNLLASTQTLAYAQSVNEQTPQGGIGAQRGPTNLSYQVAVDSLRSLGMSDRQIEELQRARQAASEIHIFAPITGFVIARNISPGQRFDKGVELYRISDLGHVWIVTDIYEKDGDFLRPGQTATVRYGGREFQARMSDALPQFDPQSRTLKARFELDNPGYVLRPDMFVDVELHVNVPSAITVPADAIIDSGARKTVFVERGDGQFEPRLIETGWRLGERVQVASGITPGERIVVSGNFLIDSESRMKAATAGDGGGMPSMVEASAGEKDPVCNMTVDPKAHGTLTMQYGGRTWYFCSDQCRKAFAADPAKYGSKKHAGQAAGKHPHNGGV